MVKHACVGVFVYVVYLAVFVFPNLPHYVYDKYCQDTTTLGRD